MKQMYANVTKAGNYILYIGEYCYFNNKVDVAAIPQNTSLDRIKVRNGYSTLVVFSKNKRKQLEEELLITNYGQLLTALVNDNPRVQEIILEGRGCYTAKDKLKIFIGYFKKLNWTTDFKVPPVLVFDDPIRHLVLDPEKYSSEFVTAISGAELKEIRKAIMTSDMIDDILQEARKKALNKEIQDTKAKLTKATEELALLEKQQRALAAS